MSASNADVDVFQMRFLSRVAAESRRVGRLHGATFASAHESYAVILEELEEYKAEVFKKREKRDERLMILELIQIAASCEKAAVTIATRNSDAFPAHDLEASA